LPTAGRRRADKLTCWYLERCRVGRARGIVAWHSGREKKLLGTGARTTSLTSILTMWRRVSGRRRKHLGRVEARDLVEEASHRALESGKSLREVLLSEPRLGEVFSEGELDAALDPVRYLGSAGKFVDRALKRYREGEN
jgi:hypothetical protein